VAAIRTYLDRFWDRSLADFKAYVEQQHAPEQDVAQLLDGGPADTPYEKKQE
jgi:hypothetical protein